MFGENKDSLEGAMLVRTDGQMDGLMAALSLLIPDRQMHGKLFDLPMAGRGVWQLVVHPASIETGFCFALINCHR